VNIPGHVNREPLGEIADRRLRRGIGWNAGQWTESIHGGDVEDNASLRSGHVFADDLAWKDRSYDVQPHDEFNGFRRSWKNDSSGLVVALRLFPPAPLIRQSIFPYFTMTASTAF